jgi:molecular chaperone GrpE (heat shock protein)
MNRERILRDFSSWLDERSADLVKPLPDRFDEVMADDGATGLPPVTRMTGNNEDPIAIDKEPDLMTLMSALVALKEEVRRLSMENRNQTERLDSVWNERGGSATQSQNDPVVECLIDLSDRIDRNIDAFDSIGRKRWRLPWVRTHSSRMKTALDGLRMTQESIQDILRNRGIASRNASELPFDPTWMQAIAVESVSGSAGKVVRHYGRAYFRGEMVVRYARVVIGVNGREAVNESAD